nr:MAG TPA: hypothetical protein [Caudoviricetes sp.]
MPIFSYLCIWRKDEEICPLSALSSDILGLQYSHNCGQS